MAMLLKSYQAPVLFVSVLCIFIATAAVSSEVQTSSAKVTLHVEENQVTMDNGILQVTFSKPRGHMTGIKYNGIDNVLDYPHPQSNLGGFWDADWNYPGSTKAAGMDMLEGTDFKAIVETDEQVEISFNRRWDVSLKNKLAYLHTDIRYIMLRGVSGFYTYGILEHEKGWPAFDIAEARIAFKLNGDRFNYIAVSDNRQKEMPAYTDRDPPKAGPLAYKEAVLLVNPSVPELKGQVDDKYQYSMDNKDNKVHGWISDNPSTGFWVITPSNEFKTGGPLKQDLTSHTGPISLVMFLGDHYVGRDIHLSIQDGEYWKKTLGPIFIYLNSNSNQTHSGNPRDLLWQDAKAQMEKEVKNWPYNFPASKDFLKQNERGTVTGSFSVYDWYNKTSTPIDFPYVGLALPGQPGSWQSECKSYQFWTRADAKGSFTINNIIPGNYSLYAWAPGFVGDFMHNVTILISAGSKIDVGVLTFRPPRAGPTLWEIGVPDRSAAEFFIPDVKENINKLYTTFDKFRQYGLWERYTDLYPKEDIVYNVGTSDYKKDWFFAQVTRKVGNEYHPTTWQIKFPLTNIQQSGTYMLRLALATAHMSRLEVQVNDPKGKPLLQTHKFGDGNAIARHGIHGFHWNYEVPIDGKLLIKGQNTIYLTQSFGGSMFCGIMYDYLRFEGPNVASTPAPKDTESEL